MIYKWNQDINFHNTGDGIMIGAWWWICGMIHIFTTQYMFMVPRLKKLAKQLEFYDTHLRKAIMVGLCISPDNKLGLCISPDIVRLALFSYTF